MTLTQIYVCLDRRYCHLATIISSFIKSVPMTIQIVYYIFYVTIIMPTSI